MNETQVLINLISSDPDAQPDALAALAASAALAVSDIPFAGPLSECRVARINGEFVINPDRSAMADSDMELMVAATIDNVMMVEGEAKECSEQDVVEAIKIAHEAIKVQCQAQLDLANKVGEKATVKRVLEPHAEDEEIKAMVEAKAKDGIYAVCKGFHDKQGRKDGYKAVKVKLKADIEEALGAEAYAERKHFINKYLYKLQKEVIREMVLAEGVRLDGRPTDKVRSIWTEVDYLPTTHGSAIFTRGETQSLTSLTMGTKLDQQMVDTALVHGFENFILHYNFPAYSVGEVKMMRGPGRREVGHANLAARALRQVLPEDNLYTLRLVSDIMESNGSSSMATVCAGSMALMDAGVKIKAPVAGIAMGMISDGDRFAILSDILGDEDAVGDMDFKLTGTAKGITACQMDIKIEGLPYEMLEKALMQAKEGRNHILGEMAKTISVPREDFKAHAPRIVELIIDKSYIGAVIGPGGSIIKELQATTDTIINIKEEGDKGVVNISSPNKASIDAALAQIKAITFTPEVGDEFDAKVASVMPYGVFVDFAGKSGLVHVSELDHVRIDRVEDVLKVGDAIKVKLIGIDEKTGKLRLSRKALLPRPERENSPRRD
jgi:polyribonucleotide nucleotidyltransferase